MNKKKVTVALAATLISTSFLPAISYAATTNNHKVDWLVEKRWVLGRDGGDLALDKTISRAEFVKMILATSGLLDEAESEKDKESKYKDVEKSHWANGYINLATKKGLVYGDDNGNFRPDENISYNEILAILSRLTPEFKENPVSGSIWADQYVKFSRDNGYLNGVEILNSDYAQNALREKTFEIIYNFYHRGIKEAEKPKNDPAWPWFVILGDGSYRRPVYEKPSPSVPSRVDKNALYNALINASNLRRANRISVDGKDVDKNLTWVTNAEHNDLYNAYQRADRIYKTDNVSQYDVDRATEDLNRAIRNYNPKNGLKSAPVVDEEIITKTETEVIPYKTETIEDPTLDKGQTVVDREGENGIITITKKIRVVNGIEKEVISTDRTITKQPVNKIVRIGSKSVVTTKDEVKTVEIPFDTKTIEDPDLEEGKTVVEQEGKNGSKNIITTITYIDGVESDRTTREEKIIEPVDKIVREGKKVVVPEEPVEKVTVTFDSKGGSAVTSQTVDKGQPATKPADPTRTGYNFTGWTLNGTSYDFATPVESNITLEANWEAKPVEKVIVTFNSKGGSAVTSQTVDKGQPVTKPADPTREGYNFKGWTLNGASYDFTTPVESNITLEANWEAKPIEKVTVTFDSKGGSAVASQEVDKGQQATKPADPTREGYNFKGWTLNGASYDFTTPVESNITLEANWEAKPVVDEKELIEKFRQDQNNKFSLSDRQFNTIYYYDIDPGYSGKNNTPANSTQRDNAVKRMENLNFNINGKTYEIAINPNSTVELEAGFASGSGIATFASIAVNNNFEKKPVDNLTKVTITSTLFEGEKVFSNYQLQNSYNLAMKLFAENIGDPLTSLIGHEVTITQEFKLSDGQTYTNTNTIKFTDNYKLQDPILEKTTAKKAEIIDVELLDAKSYMLTAQLTNAEYKNVKSVRFDYALDEYLVDEDNTIAPGFKDDEETDDYTKILFNDEKGIAKYVIIEFDDNTRLKLNIPEY